MDSAQMHFFFHINGIFSYFSDTKQDVKLLDRACMIVVGLNLSSHQGDFVDILLAFTICSTKGENLTQPPH